MIRPVILALVAVAAPLAPAAAAVTFDLGAAAGAATSFGYQVNGTPLTVTAATYRVAPAALVATGQLKAGATVTRSAGGLGVATTGETAGQTPQVDTDGILKEVLVLTLSTPGRLTGARFNYVDANDTLRLYGLRADGALDYLGFPGEFFDNTALDQPMHGGATVTGHTGRGAISDAWTFDVAFSGTREYSAFYFTGQNAGADGYRLQSATFAAVPEPATWGMMAMGFSVIGAVARARRRRTAMAVA